jgi:gamma-glutamylcysteine synthetase
MDIFPLVSALFANYQQNGGDWERENSHLKNIWEMIIRSRLKLIIRGTNKKKIRETPRRVVE